MLFSCPLNPLLLCYVAGKNGSSIGLFLCVWYEGTYFAMAGSVEVAAWLQTRYWLHRFAVFIFPLQWDLNQTLALLFR